MRMDNSFMIIFKDKIIDKLNGLGDKYPLGFLAGKIC